MKAPFVGKNSKKFPDGIEVVLHFVFMYIPSLTELGLSCNFAHLFQYNRYNMPMHFPSLTMSFNTLINVFPQFGMYSNACGVSEWTYTGVKHYEKVSFINSQLIQIILSIITLTPRFAVVVENTRTVEPIWDESK